MSDCCFSDEEPNLFKTERTLALVDTHVNGPTIDGIERLQVDSRERLLWGDCVEKVRSCRGRWAVIQSVGAPGYSR